MNLIAFNPENELEIAIVESKQGALAVESLLRLAADSNLYISSKREVQQDGSGFDPLLLGEVGNPLVAAFSSLSRPGIHSHIAEYILQMRGREFFLRLPPGYGIILNPGYVVQLIISPDAASAFKNALKTN